MNKHESYASLETAKLLKQAGFDWECNRHYTEGRNILFEKAEKGHVIITRNQSEYPSLYFAPTLEVAQRWLREVKECAVIVETHNVQAACVSAYVYCIYPIDATHPCEHINGFAEDQCFGTYEEAQEAGIKKALEIILEENENR